MTISNYYNRIQLIKMKITVKQILNIHKRVNRETTHTIKPIVTTNRKKHNNKYACRKKIDNNKYNF